MSRARLGVPRHELGVVDSTQRVARELARAGAPEGTVVIAEHQEEGRGRAGRAWLDVPGENLLFSLVLRPTLAPRQVPQLALVAAVAIAEAIEGVTGAVPRIKWPNDLLLETRKVCGVLAEAVSDGDTVAVVVLGIGINVNQRAFPAALADGATSLALELGRPLDRRGLLDAALTRLDHWYEIHGRDGFGAVEPAWSRRSALAGRPVVSGAVRGIAVGIDEEGALLVREESGRTHRVVAGEVARWGS